MASNGAGGSKGFGGGREIDVARLKEPDEAEWRRLMDLYTRPLNLFFHARGHRADAADLLQETFIRAMNAIDRYDPDVAPLYGWIVTIARNESSRLLRQQYRRSEVELPADVRGSSESDGFAFWFDLRRALARLRPSEREAFYLRHVQGLSGSEAAAISGRTEAAVNMGASRASRELIKLLNDYAP